MRSHAAGTTVRQPVYLQPGDVIIVLRDLAQFPVRQRAEGRRPLLVIDEAQNLSPQALEEVRLLSNLETEKSKLLQILVAGQPNLRATIESPHLEQFRQRVAVSYHLTALDAPDTAAYINYRLQHAALGEPLPFPATAAGLVHSRSRGVPRIINVICDAALVFGYAEERYQIDRALPEEVIAELETTGVLLPPAPEKPLPPQLASGVARPPAEPSGAAPTAAQVLERPPARCPGRPDAGTGGGRRDREGTRAGARARETPAGGVSAREESLAHRERQIALQQQIMSEEYRSLRQQRADRLASVPPGRNTAAAGLSRFREEASLGTALAPDRPAVRPGSRAQTLTIG